MKRIITVLMVSIFTLGLSAAVASANDGPPGPVIPPDANHADHPARPCNGDNSGPYRAEKCPPAPKPPVVCPPGTVPNPMMDGAGHKAQARAAKARKARRARHARHHGKGDDHGDKNHGDKNHGDKKHDDKPKPPKQPDCVPAPPVVVPPVQPPAVVPPAVTPPATTPVAAPAAPAATTPVVQGVAKKVAAKKRAAKRKAARKRATQKARKRAEAGPKFTG